MVGDIMQPTHLLFVLVVALLVLGPKRLPEVGRTLGSGIRDFRQALSGEHHDSEHVTAAQTPAEQHDQPSTAGGDGDAKTPWHDEAIGPTSFDEPISFDSDAATEHDDAPISFDSDAATEAHSPAEPATEAHTAPEPATQVHGPSEPATEVHGTAEAETTQPAEPRTEPAA